MTMPMPPVRSNGVHGSDSPPAPAGLPVVRVIASNGAEAPLRALLERHGLSESPDPDVVVSAGSSETAESLVRRSKAEHPAAHVVLLLDTSTPAEARQLLVSGVAGLVLEEHVEIALAPAVLAAAAGQVSYPADLMPTRLRSALSAREKQILGMVVMGFGNAEIAAKLHVSESTVKSHLHSAFATLGVRSRKDAVALILDPDAGFGTGILAITQSG